MENQSERDELSTIVDQIDTLINYIDDHLNTSSPSFYGTGIAQDAGTGDQRTTGPLTTRLFDSLIDTVVTKPINYGVELVEDVLGIEHKKKPNYAINPYGQNGWAVPGGQFSGAQNAWLPPGGQYPPSQSPFPPSSGNNVFNPSGQNAWLPPGGQFPPSQSSLPPTSGNNMFNSSGQNAWLPPGGQFPPSQSSFPPTSGNNMFNSSGQNAWLPPGGKFPPSQSSFPPTSGNNNMFNSYGQNARLPPGGKFPPSQSSFPPTSGNNNMFNSSGQNAQLAPGGRFPPSQSSFPPTSGNNVYNPPVQNAWLPPGGQSPPSQPLQSTNNVNSVFGPSGQNSGSMVGEKTSLHQLPSFPPANSGNTFDISRQNTWSVPGGENPTPKLPFPPVKGSNISNSSQFPPSQQKFQPYKNTGKAQELLEKNQLPSFEQTQPQQSPPVTLVPGSYQGVPEQPILRPKQLVGETNQPIHNSLNSPHSTKSRIPLPNYKQTYPSHFTQSCKPKPILC